MSGKAFRTPCLRVRARRKSTNRRFVKKNIYLEKSRDWILKTWRQVGIGFSKHREKKVGSQNFSKNNFAGGGGGR